MNNVLLTFAGLPLALAAAHSLLAPASLPAPEPLPVAVSAPEFVGPEFDLSPEEVECVAKTVHFEAGIGAYIDKVAVARVVKTRTETGGYPDTFCGVVTEARKPGRWNCQFTWYCDGKSDEFPNATAQNRSSYIATLVMRGKYDDLLQGVTHYHATYARPGWAKRMKEVTQVGQHKFYLDSKNQSLMTNY